MFYIQLSPTGLPVEVSDIFPKEAEWARPKKGVLGSGWISSRDCSSKEHANSLASYLTAMTGETYLGADEGSGTYPRYRVVKAPKIGDLVSRTFNGDTYPCGEIIKITPTWIVTTSEGTKFRRYKDTGGWREAGRGFWMIGGHVYEQNPHF